MNKYYSYPNIELWRDDMWVDHISNIDGLIQWNQSNDVVNPNAYASDYSGDLLKHPGYRPKTAGIDDPEVLSYWTEKGVHLEVLSQGGKRWVAMLPKKALKERQNKLPALVVTHLEDYSDPWWAMKTVEYHKDYADMLAQSLDFLLVFLVSEGNDEDMIYLNIMQEAFILFPTDLDRLYVDVSLAQEKGQSLADIPNFNTPKIADEMLENFGSLNIPVVNIAGIWGNRDSLTRGLIMYHAMNKGKFDKEWLIHSRVGKQLMEGVVLEHRFDDLYHPDLLSYWADMGLKFESHEKNGERWTSMVPLCAFEEEKKLPVLLVMQEVYPGNEHLALTAKSYFYRVCEIAAQGECIALFFALEDPDSNDLFAEILEEATELYPVDRSRVYITGHSHDGFFAYEFAYRHPELLAAVATLGDPRGLRSPEATGNPVMSICDDQLEALSKVDLPVMNLAGTNEGFGTIPQEKEAFAEYVQAWQRRLKASRCTQRSAEEIEAAQKSSDYATRKLGVPVDKSWTLWADGFEHYFGEINNVEGKPHLCLMLSQNMPHTTTPFMLEMAWSFLRRFSRNLETGEIEELY